MNHWREKALAAALGGLVLLGPVEATAAPPGAAAETRPDAVAKADAALSPDARDALRWIVASRDTQGRPFGVVDKRAAKLHLFDRDGRHVASAPALLGLAVGDEGLPGVGAIPVERIPAAARTTPAGRYPSEPGLAKVGAGTDAVVWIDYEAGLSIHRVRPGAPSERRLQRLASPSPADKRASYGCVVVDGAFFDSAVWPTLGRGRGVVYVLPETRPVQALFGGDRLAALGE